MCKIYFENKVIVICSPFQIPQGKRVFNLEQFSVDKILLHLQQQSDKKVYLSSSFSSTSEQLLSTFKKKIEVVQAAGGVVFNANGKVLFIKRNGIWDLPKGKLEIGESLQSCSLREVMEETGVQNLSVTSFNCITYHIFKRDGHFFLKETHWYNMYSDFSGELIPQSQEGIEKAKWIGVKKISKIFKNTYPSISSIASEFKITAG